MKRYIIPSSIALLIVGGSLLIIFKNTSDEQLVPTIIQPEVKIEAKTSTGELTTSEILSTLEEQLPVMEVEEFIEEEMEEVEPEIQIVEESKPVVDHISPIAIIFYLKTG